MSRTFVTCAAIIGLTIGLSSQAIASGMGDQADQASTVIERFRDMPERGIPEAVLRDAKGLAVLTVFKAGFWFTGQGGRGVVIARTPHGWSGPSAIGTGGVGFGPQIGAEVSELVLVLNTPEAVNAFARGANVTLGGDLSVAAGPIGRDMGARLMPVAAVYTYSRSQGLFAGVAAEGTVIATRDGANRDYYGRDVTTKAILSGRARPPRDADKLRVALAGR